MQPQQTGAVMEIWLRANLQAHGFLGASYWRENQQTVLREYLPAARTYVWVQRGQVRGFLSVSPEGYIGALFVAPAFQDHGVGGALLRHCKGRFPALELAVYEKNERAVKFYKRNGFRIVGEREGAQGNKEYVMRWE